MLAIVWAGAAAAIVLKFVWVAAPKWLTAAIGIALGWVALVALPQLLTRLNPSTLILLVVGGLAYTAGAVVYARQRPDPAPAVFGYHELFHALTIVGVASRLPSSSSAPSNTRARQPRFSRYSNPGGSASTRRTAAWASSRRCASPQAAGPRLLLFATGLFFTRLAIVPVSDVESVIPRRKTVLLHSAEG